MKSTELFRALVLALTVSSSTALVTANQVPLSFLALRGRSTTTTKPYVPITPDAFPTATRTSSSCLHAAAKRAASKMTLAGKILPALQKFLIGPAKFKAIVTNVVSMTHWVDLLVLAAVAWGVRPLAQFTYERGLGRRDDNHDQQQQPASFEASRRYWTAQTAAQVALVALSVYAVDVMSVVLSTVGFRFVDQTDYPANYAKVAYTTLAVQKLLRLKTATLCRLFKVSPDNMGRLDVLDRLVNGLIVSLVSLVLLDWLSVQMGMAMRGLFAFGSVGTLAFTLASQGLLTQLMSGGFLIFSNKMNVGDYVTFGDNVAGTVTKLGWFDTTLRGADNTVTRIPNAGLASQNISNLSRVRQCQVAQTLRFHYEDVDVLPAVLDSIKEEIKRSCPRLITDGTRPFRVSWTDFNQDHLQVTVNTHFNLAPLGDAYWNTRQAVLMAIARAVKKHGIQLAQMYSFATSGSEPEWRVLPKRSFTRVRAQKEDEGEGTTNGSSETNRSESDTLTD